MKNEINDLNRNPLLRQLLSNYCLMVYEENAIIDDEHLLSEYRWLVANNKLDEIFLYEHKTEKPFQKYL